MSKNPKPLHPKTRRLRCVLFLLSLGPSGAIEEARGQGVRQRRQRALAGPGAEGHARVVAEDADSHLRLRPALGINLPLDKAASAGGEADKGLT